jgi:hypothetical protein
MRGATIAICLALGCAHQSRRPLPVAGWRELRSAHFTLRTDLPEDSARSTLKKLETLRWWLQAAWSTGGDSPGRTQANVLSDWAELSTFTASPGIATLSRNGPLLGTAGQTAELLDARSPATAILADEVAHELIRRRMPGAPRWFHEALWAIAARMRGGEASAAQVRTELEAAVAVAAAEPVPRLQLAELERDPALRRARAEALEPWNPTVFVTRALILGATGSCDGAAEAMQHALDVLPDNRAPADVQALVERRVRISAACRPGAGPR